MSRGYAKHLLVFNSANSSTYTSNAFFVQDAATISVSVQTVVATASTITIQGSNDHGLNDSAATVAAWSTVTALTAFPALVTIDPGLRWLRFQRGSQESLSTTQMATWCT